MTVLSGVPIRDRDGSGGVQYNLIAKIQDVGLTFNDTPVLLTGTVEVASGSLNTVDGTGTTFLTQVSLGDTISISGEARIVATISSNTELTVTSAFGSAKAAGLTATLVGGAGTVDITLANGTAITASNTPFRKYYFTNETASVDDVITGADASGVVSHEHTAIMDFAKRDAALRNEVQALCVSAVVIINVDCNDFAQLYGGQCGRGMTVASGTGNSGTLAADGSKYNLTITGRYGRMPYNITAAQLALLDPENA